MKRFLPLAVFAVLVIAAGAYFFSQSSDGELAVTEAETTSAVEEAGETAAEMATVGEIEEMVLGNADAPITIIEYASYTCPHCATFHENVYAYLKADYIDTGKAKFVFREVYFDRFGLWASMVARCGGQERFFGITDLLFKGQKDWTAAGDPVAIADELRKVGRLAGLGDEALDACLQNEDQAKALVEWYQANAAKDDINSTPSFVINGTKYQNMSYADMKTLLDGLL